MGPSTAALALTAQNTSPPHCQGGLRHSQPHQRPTRAFPPTAQESCGKPPGGSAEETAGSRDRADASAARDDPQRPAGPPADSACLLPSRTGLLAASPKEAVATGRTRRQREVEAGPRGGPRPAALSPYSLGGGSGWKAKCATVRRGAPGSGARRPQSPAGSAARSAHPATAIAAMPVRRRQRLLKRRGPGPAFYWPAPPGCGPISGGSAVGGGVGGRVPACAWGARPGPGTGGGTRAARERRERALRAGARRSRAPPQRREQGQGQPQATATAAAIGTATAIGAATAVAAVIGTTTGGLA